MELHETLYSIALNFYSVLTTIKKINNAGILLKQDKPIFINRYFVYRNVELVFKLDYRNSLTYYNSGITQNQKCPGWPSFSRYKLKIRNVPEDLILVVINI